MKRTLAVAALVILSMVFLGCIGAPVPPQPQNPGAPPSPPADNLTGIANPASVYCTEKGYTLDIRKDASGGEAGYCVFGNGHECEEWSYYRGECSEKGGIERAAGEGEFCGGIAGIACASGLGCRLDGDYPDAGGKCMHPSERQFILCTADRKDICTMEYEPVCGRSGNQPSLYDFQDYPSECVACSKVSPALGYYGGRCKDINLTGGKAKRKDTLYDCPSVRYDACAAINDPACGRAISPTDTAPYYRNYASPCEACSVRSNAIAYYVGNCSSRQ